MNSEREDGREFSALLSAMLDGAMTSAEDRRLGDLLRDNPKMQRAYLDFCWTHALLRQELGAFPETAALGASSLPLVSHLAPLAGPFDGSPPDGLPGVSLGGFASSAVVCYALLGLILTVGIFFAWAWSPANRATGFAKGPAARRSETAVVGKVTRLMNCRWADGSDVAEQDANVTLGRKFDLTAGRLEIVYNSGLAMAIQGPATFEADSMYGGFLSRGMLAVRTKAPSQSWRADAGPDRLSRFLIIRTPTAVASEVDADFQLEVDPSGATLVHGSRGTIELQLAGDGPGRGVVLHGNLHARVEAAGIFRGITLAGGPTDAAVVSTYTSRAALARLIAGDRMATPGAGEAGWQFVSLDRVAVAKAVPADAAPDRAGQDDRSVEIRWKARSKFTYHAEFEPFQRDAAAGKPHVFVSYAAHNRLIGVRLNGKELPGPWACDDAVQQFGALAIDEGFRDGVNVLEFDVLTNSLNPAREPPLRMSGALFGFRQVQPARNAPLNRQPSELQFDSRTGKSI